MQAAIVSVGSEILRGALLDTNAQYFARELTTIGLEVVRVSQAPDDLDTITSVLRESIELADIVVVSGGLGPTEDDLTREAVMALTGESPTVDEDVVAAIRARFAARGDEMPSRNIKQAWTIPSARIIANPHGTAPGWLVEFNDRLIAILPGPPRENRPMWELQIRPHIVLRATDQAIVTRTIKTIGIGESAVADAIDDLIAREWPVVGTYAKSDGVHVSITANHPDRSVAAATVRAVTAEAVERLAPYVYGMGDDSLAAAVVQPLTAAGIKIGVCELGSGGGLSALLLADPAAESAIAWSSLLPLHAVDGYRERSAEDLAASAARQHAGSRDLGTIAVVALKSASTDSDVTTGEVGLALAHAGRLRTDERKIQGTTEELRRRTALLGAEFLWRELRIAAGLLNRDG